MKKVTLATAALVMSFAGTAIAEGDPAKGEKDFKKCRACHMIVNGDEVIVKGGRTGPNLYGLVGRAAGSEDFKYGASIVAAGEAGLVWTEELLVAYIADPRAFLRENTGDSKAKSKMTFKLKNADDVVAYLASLAPPAE
ncbi:MAG: c-type cytochrome [Marinosulfonomonas sp.]|nr:c-type cytochrome [Marinosulfonomonas sp.]